VREEQKYMCVARTSNNRVISPGDLYCCLLPRCEALRVCRSGFPIATPSTLNSLEVKIDTNIYIGQKPVKPQYEIPKLQIL